MLQAPELLFLVSFFTWIKIYGDYRGDPIHRTTRQISHTHIRWLKCAIPIFWHTELVWESSRCRSFTMCFWINWPEFHAGTPTILACYFSTSLSIIIIFLLITANYGLCFLSSRHQCKIACCFTFLATFICPTKLFIRTITYILLYLNSIKTETSPHDRPIQYSSCIRLKLHLFRFLNALQGCLDPMNSL